MAQNGALICLVMGYVKKGIDSQLIMLHRDMDPFLGIQAAEGEQTMKHVVRIAILMLGLVGVYASAAVPQLPAPDGMPISTHPGMYSSAVPQLPAPDGIPISTHPGR